MNKNKIIFRFLTGDCNWQQYGGKFISKKLNNGDWDYWLLIEVTNMWDSCGKEENLAQYNVCVTAVSPEAAGKDNLKKAFECCGMEDEENQKNKLVQVECLASYGVSANLWQGNGNNLNKLMREARAQAQLISSITFGFAMDRPENKLGNNGWDFISGNIGFRS